MHPIDRILDLQLLGKHAEARKISDELELLGPDRIPDTKGQLGNSDVWIRHCFNRGWFLLQEGKYQEACQLLENGRFISVYGSGLFKTTKPIYNPSVHDIKGRKLIISLEGGYGDEIIHAKFATSFKKLGADKVYLAADPTLHSLFKRIEGVDGLITRNESHLIDHDFWVPGFSAGWLAGHTIEDIPNKPFLSANPDSIEMWKHLVKAEQGQIKVGIRWAGNPKFEHQQFRKFPEQFLLNLAKYPELKIYSFQRDHNTIELPSGITDLQHFLISWEDTAAAIMNLDIVITSCTSIAHLSAALGKETWIMVPILPYHTWTYKCPENDTSPFYDSVKLFRQREPKKWNATFQKMYATLEEKFNLTHIDLPNEDKEYKRINLGCGQNKLPNFTNIDIDPSVNPDHIIDLNHAPWPIKNNEYNHIVATNILEKLDMSKDNFTEIINEMYRISDNGAVWEIEIPHWRHDESVFNIINKRLFTPNNFYVYSKNYIFQKLTKQEKIDKIYLEHDIDIEVIDLRYVYTPFWKKQIDEKIITEDDLLFALNHYNNVASAFRLLIQVHKPARYSNQELLFEFNKNKGRSV